MSVLFAATLLAFPLSPASAENDALSRVAAADPVAGKKLFLRCKACHTTDKTARHGLGPNLWDIVGRKKAAAKSFRYSTALGGIGGVWDYDALDAYIENPRKFAPGNRMAFAGISSDGQRAAVIAYLRTLSDTPRDLPKTSLLAPTTATADPAEAEDFGGLPPDEGREETHAICGACHSLRLVTQQGLDADRWDGLMDWMTQKQGMPELEKDERQRIVSYLAKYYGPDRRSRPRTDPMRPMMPAMPMMAPPPMAPPMPPQP
ncbi:MAG: cytochrome c family protein [Proteobacteria bacterium]|nr:cytochrome c family protein [Pseudomonadota bacterium]